MQQVGHDGADGCGLEAEGGDRAPARAGAERGMRGIARRGLCLVLAGPSGGGKTSVARALLEAETGLRLSVSVTTRPPRPAEREGVDYYFRDRGGFPAAGGGGSAAGVGAGAGTTLLWHATGAGLQRRWQPERTCCSTSTGRGSTVCGRRCPAMWSGCFCCRPRWRRCGSGWRGVAGRIRRRSIGGWTEAREEISHAPAFDHVIVNESFDGTVVRVRDVLWAARTATERLIGLRDWIGGLEAS